MANATAASTHAPKMKESSLCRNASAPRHNPARIIHANCRPGFTLPLRTAAIVRPAINAAPTPITPNRKRKRAIGNTLFNMPYTTGKVQAVIYSQKRGILKHTHEHQSHNSDRARHRYCDGPRLRPERTAEPSDADVGDA